MNTPFHIPVLRLGTPYDSMDSIAISHRTTGATLATVGQANNGLIRRDMQKIHDSYKALQALSCEQLLSICRTAGNYFMHESLPMGAGGVTQSPQEYIEALSITSGLPHSLCRANMAKIYEVFTEMEAIVRGLTRGLDLGVIDEGLGTQFDSPISYYAETHSLGVVLPSNSPGVNSIWMPSIALKIPVVLKPGKDEPWTPYRIIQAFIAAGCPREAFGFYPTGHDGANTIMTECGRSIIFGDENTIAQYANDPAVQVHGPGWSKILIGDDCIESWRDYIDLLADSVVRNGGRSCVNASAILVPKYGREIADALAENLASIQPRPMDDDKARLSAFANHAFADFIDAAIEEGLRCAGAVDVTAEKRGGSRKVHFEHEVYLLPTVIYCDSIAHPLANREFMCPFVSVVEMPQADMLQGIGDSLVVSAITKDKRWMQDLLRCAHIQRLNIGPVSTCTVSWNQPHEGNLFEFLYSRRAVALAGI